jgi:uncharacterized protein with FMN-binding domain
MKKISRVVLTVTGLSVLAVGWRAGEAPLVAAQSIVSASSTQTSTDSSTTDASAADSSAAPSATATQAPEASAAAAATYVGPAVDTRYGTFQVQLVVEGGVVTAVDAVQSGQSENHSARINASAIPTLMSEVLDAQTFNVSYVSGASYTSEGILSSVEGALADAGMV